MIRRSARSDDPARQRREIMVLKAQRAELEAWVAEQAGQAAEAAASMSRHIWLRGLAAGYLSVMAGGPPLPWTVTTLGSLGTGGTPMVTKY